MTTTARIENKARVSSPRLLGWIDGLLRHVFPHVCEICGDREAGPKESFICATCLTHPKAVLPIEPPFCQRCGSTFDGHITTEFTCTSCQDLELHFVSARAAVHHAGVVKQAIIRFKYNGQRWFEPFLSDLLIRAVRKQLPEQSPGIIAPIPLHPRRYRARGFNQSEALAERLSQALNIPHDPHLLKRTRDTPAQAGLDRDHRIENVKNAFAFARKEKLRGENVLLIDDVLTTGSTASACAKELRKHGAGNVFVWTVARGGFDQ